MAFFIFVCLVVITSLAVLFILGTLLAKSLARAFGSRKASLKNSGLVVGSGLLVSWVPVLNLVLVPTALAYSSKKLLGLTVGRSISFGLITGVLAFFTLPLLLALGVHFQVMQAFSVTGNSMQPTLQNNDYLIVSKLERAFERGDVILFKYPKDQEHTGISRIVGLPGDKVIIKNGKVTIYMPGDTKGIEDTRSETAGEVDLMVNDNHYFVLGDNRSQNGASDSREWGLVPDANVVGSAKFRLKPTYLEI